MTEIKSTLDIVMEKTKGLRLTEEDKERFREEELSREAKGLCRLYMDGQLDWEAVETDFQGQEDRDRPIMKKAFYNHLLQSIDIGSYNDLAARAIGALSNGKARETLKKINDLSSAFFKARQKKQKKIRPALWAKLAKKGISGSAVEPNVNDSQEGKEMEKELAMEYRGKLNELKERLAKSFEGSYMT